MLRTEISNLLKVITKALNELDDSQFLKLIQGKGKIKFVDLGEREKVKRPNRKNTNKVALNDSEIQSLAIEIRKCQTREEAAELLHMNGREIRRESLERLARILQVYIAKSDRISVIEDKIIEFAVGVRLRTEAIRGLKFKS